MAEADGDGSTGRRTATKGKAAAPPPPGPGEEAKGLEPVCTVAFCPICMAVTAAQGAAPDALEHLLAAAREFFLAARAVVDARGDHLADPAAGRKTGATFEKIDVS